MSSSETGHAAEARDRDLTRYLERFGDAVRRGLITEAEMIQLAKLDIAYDRAGIA